jgi:hypothetical protein
MARIHPQRCDPVAQYRARYDVHLEPSRRGIGRAVGIEWDMQATTVENLRTIVSEVGVGFLDQLDRLGH